MIYILLSCLFILFILVIIFALGFCWGASKADQSLGYKDKAGGAAMTLAKIWGFGLIAAVISIMFGVVLLESGFTFTQSAPGLLICFLAVYLALRTLGK